MNTVIDVLLEIPVDIQRKLAQGTYERVGGVVREADTKHVVTWLKQVSPTETVNQVVNLPTLLSGTAAAGSVLTLGVSVLGFGMLSKQLNKLETQLKETQALLAKINRKLDLSFYANFAAALDMAQGAMRMQKEEHRRQAALQAIDRFLEAEHVYTGLVKEELAQASPIADEYLLTLALAYVAEARCYLELEEIDSAVAAFERGETNLRYLVQQYVEMLLSDHASVFLHPSLKDDISLTRLTKIYQWTAPTLDESQVFDRLREDLFRFREDRNHWVDELPPAILMREEVKGGQKPRKEEALKRLPEALGTLESMTEIHQRFLAYQLEAKALKSLSMPFATWQNLAPIDSKVLGSDSVVCILPTEPIAL